MSSDAVRTAVAIQRIRGSRRSLGNDYDAFACDPSLKDEIGMLPRTLEPEVMDTAEEAADYDSMNHSTVNRVFVGDFVAEVRHQTSDASGEREVRDRKSEVGNSCSPLAPRPSTILDVGTGTALIPIELVNQLRQVREGEAPAEPEQSGCPPLEEAPQERRPPDAHCIHITAIDLAEEMLKLGRINVERAGYSDCITLELVDAKGLPYADGAFDAVMSNSIVHHIPKPRDTLAEMWRVLKPGGLLFVRDLLRPETADDVERIVAAYAGNESPRQQQLFRQSLHAALTVVEVGAMLAEIGIANGRPAVGSVARSGDRSQRERECVRQTSDRHWTIVAWR